MTFVGPTSGPELPDLRGFMMHTKEHFEEHVLEHHGEELNGCDGKQLALARVAVHLLGELQAAASLLSTLGVRKLRVALVRGGLQRWAAVHLEWP